MYARLRGVREGQIDDVIMTLIENLLLMDHINKQAGDLRYITLELLSRVCA